MLFNEPKLLKYARRWSAVSAVGGFSALQRAEIAEILIRHLTRLSFARFSALQRAEIAEIVQSTALIVLAMSEFQCSSTSRNC